MPHPWRPRLYPPRPPLRPTPPHTAAATLHPERARSRPPTRGRPQPVSADALLLWGWLLLTLPSSLPIFLLVPLRLCEIRVQAERLRGDRLLAHDKLSAAHSERCRRGRVELDRRAPPGYICLQAGWGEPRCIPRQPLTPRVATLDTWSRSLDLPPPPPFTHRYSPLHSKRQLHAYRGHSPLEWRLRPYGGPMCRRVRPHVRRACRWRCAP